MRRCDVLVVGGGPAGSTCAGALVREGFDVVVADKAEFPRDKVCAGWITPAVVDELGLDLSDYAAGGRTIDPIHGFRVGRMGDRMQVHRYAEPMSYGIRRCEFDDYLLRRCGAGLALGQRVEGFRREGGRWKVADRFECAMLVGAGGHFCPVARSVSKTEDDAVIAAEEAEYVMDGRDLAGCAVEAGLPELYFTRDLAGYGWVFRKGNYLNVGLGVRSGGSERGPRLKDRLDEFVRWLVAEKRLAHEPTSRMRGHAYLLQPDSHRTRCGEGFVLVGDAAGLAYDRSGEGIRCAVESGLLAAQTIATALAGGRSDAAALAPYARSLDDRFGAAGRSRLDPAALLPPSLREPVAAALMASPWFSRHVLLERWFLHRHEQALVPAWQLAASRRMVGAHAA